MRPQECSELGLTQVVDLLGTLTHGLELFGLLEDHFYGGIELLPRHGVLVRCADHVEGMLEVHRRSRSNGRHDMLDGGNRRCISHSKNWSNRLDR